MLPLLGICRLSVASVQTLPVDPELDPRAKLDPFLNITNEDLRKRWSHSEEELGSVLPLTYETHVLSSRLAALNTFSETTYVDVRLAGFEGDGEHEIKLEDADVQRLFDAIPLEESQHVLHPSRGDGHELPVRRRFLYRVSSAAKALASKVHSQVVANIGADGSVPLHVVDDIVRDDYIRQRNTHTTIYLLNPRLPRRVASADEANAIATAMGTQGAGKSAGAQKVRAPNNRTWGEAIKYRYMDHGPNASSAGGAGGPSAASEEAKGGCGTTRWIGRERYMWIDLSAGPVTYGPASAGDGVVTTHTLPSVSRLARQFSDRVELSRHLAVELAALTITSGRLLLAPPLVRLPDKPSALVTVVLVVVADDVAFNTAPSVDVSSIVKVGPTATAIH